ncbi:MAG: hypothetical protein ACIAS6_15455 [Phycisphaerales bacterium JB060]
MSNNVAGSVDVRSGRTLLSNMAAAILALGMLISALVLGLSIRGAGSQLANRPTSMPPHQTYGFPTAIAVGERRAIVPVESRSGTVTWHYVFPDDSSIGLVSRPISPMGDTYGTISISR